MADVLNYLKARDELDAAQTRLLDMSVDLRLDESDRAAAAANFLDLSQQIADMDSVHTALKAKIAAGGVKPPGQALIDKSLKLATDLGKVIAKAKKAEAILAAATRLVDAWTAVATGLPAAAPPPAQDDADGG